MKASELLKSVQGIIAEFGPDCRVDSFLWSPRHVREAFQELYDNACFTDEVSRSPSEGFVDAVLAEMSGQMDNEERDFVQWKSSQVTETIEAIARRISIWNEED